MHRSDHHRFTRRSLIRGAGLAAGMLSLGPALFACGSNRRGSEGVLASAEGASTIIRPARGGSLTVRIANELDNLDYAYNHDVYSGFVLGNCVEPLLMHDAQAQPKGHLAESWQNPDDQTYIFKLRQGVKFQDGTDFNAGAVAFSMDRIRTDKTSFRYQDLLTVDKLETPDPATVKITLKSPFAPFLEKLTGDAGRVISPAIAQKYGKDRLRTDLTDQGTGPFRFMEWKAGDHVTLVRNETYWGRDMSGAALPYLDKLVIRLIPDDTIALAALRAGEVDAFRPGEGPPPKDDAGARADRSLTYQSIPGLGYNYLAFNEAREPFNSRALRQSVSYAIDREVIAKSVYFDTVLPLDVVFAPSIWTEEPGYHPYLKRDLSRAKQLLAQAGRPNGFSFTYLVNNASNTDQQTAELIKDQLKEAGIDMAIQKMEFAKLTHVASNGEHQAAKIGWSADFDPDGWTYNHFNSKGSLVARTKYSNPEVDRLLDQARASLDPSKRKPLYQQAQRLFMGDAAYCVLYSAKTINLTLKKVQNYPLGPTPAAGLSQVWKVTGER